MINTYAVWYEVQNGAFELVGKMRLTIYDNCSSKQIVEFARCKFLNKLLNKYKDAGNEKLRVYDVTPRIISANKEYKLAKTDLDNLTTFLIDSNVDHSLEKATLEGGYLMSIEDIEEKTTNDPRIVKLTMRINFIFDEEEKLISIYRDIKEQPCQQAHFYKKGDDD